MAVDPSAGPVSPPPVLTRIAGAGTSSLSYTLAGGEELLVEAIAADVDASAAGDSTLLVRYVAQSGQTFAISSTVALFPGAQTGLVTFAPYLPDTVTLGVGGAESALQTGLASCDLIGGTVVRIEASDAAVVLTEGRIWASNPGGGQQLNPIAQFPLYLMPNDSNPGQLA
jgi:hypothetical protein